MTRANRSRARKVGATVLRLGSACLLALLIVGGAGYHWFETNILSTLPDDLSGVTDWRPPTTCTVYAADGSPVDDFYLERRVWVPIDELAPTTWQAFIAAEDRRFFEHPGVDPRGVARAFVENLRAGGVHQGGSTITQQLVKNLLVGNERTYERKLREAVLAVRLERELDKMRILELFINYVFLGSGNYGVEAAAQDYFGISARDLDPGQAAMVAGLIPAPSRYNPRRSPELAAWRRRITLEQMVVDGYVDEAALPAWLEAPVALPREPQVVRGKDASYVTMVRREVRRLLPSNLAFNEGLSVHTAFDPALQAVAESAVREAIAAVDKRQGRRSAAVRLSRPEWEAFLARGPGLPREQGSFVPPTPGTCFDSLVGEKRNLAALAAGPYTFALARPEWSTMVRHTDSGPMPLHQVVRAGDVLRVCLQEERTITLDPRPFAEGAAVVLESRTGRVLALVGGYEVGLEGFVRATQARRQPGSSFKPYVYAAALQQGRTQLDIVQDAPLSLSAGGGKLWTPKNYSGGSSGPMSMRSALARSVNVPAVRTALEVGMEEVVRTARAMGVRTPLRTDPTVALGSSEVTPMDQALGYATIARMGIPTDPVYIDYLVDWRGRTVNAGDPLLVAGQEVARLPGGPRPRALSAGVAYELADMLREVVHAGTARRAWVADQDRAGKTGTTNDSLDAWFVGFTPEHTIAVWVGTDGKTSLGQGETGGRTALPAWMRIVDALPSTAGQTLPMPDEAIRVKTDVGWVGLARGHVPRSALPTRIVAADDPLPGFERRAP